MYCKSCGSYMNDGTLVCSRCGAVNSATPNPAYYPVSPTVPASPLVPSNEKPRGPVALAIVALILTCIWFVAYLTLETAVYFESFEYYLEYIGHYLLRWFCNTLLPLILAILFLVFCSMKSKKSPILAGIPMIVSVAFAILLEMIDTFRYTRTEYALLLFFTVAFVIFYMLTVTGVFKNAAGKVLVIVFGCIKCALSFIILTLNMARGNYSFYSFFGTMFSLLAQTLKFVAGVLTTIAMMVYACSVLRSRTRAAHAGAPIPAYQPPMPTYQPPMYPQQPVYPQMQPPMEQPAPASTYSQSHMPLYPQGAVYPESQTPYAPQTPSAEPAEQTPTAEPENY